MHHVTPSSLLGLAIAFLIISTILVVLRLLSRRLQRLPIGIDDTMMLFSWLFATILSINTIVAVSYQLWGQDLPPRRLSNGKISTMNGYSALIARSEEFGFVQEVLLPLQLMFAKLSILFLYRRVFCIGKRNFLHWATLILIVLVSMWGMILFFMYLFQCGTRFSIAWDGPLSLEVAVCLPASLELGMGASDTLFDLIIMALPVRSILALHTRTTRKLLILGVFLVGSVTVAASVVRLAIYTSLMVGLRNQFTLMDENMIVSTEMFWLLFEAGFAVSTACLPCTQGLVIRLGERISGSLGSRGRSSTSVQRSSKSNDTTPERRLYFDIEKDGSKKVRGSVQEVISNHS